MSELKDKNGLTEKEFLELYDASGYPRPSLTADILIVAIKPKPALLLVRRGGHPYLGVWALPGGFAEPGEKIEETAARELEEETGIKDLPLQAVGFYSRPGRDPRGWTVTRSFVSLLEEIPDYRAGDDAREAAFFGIDMKKTETGYRVSLHGRDETLVAEADVEERRGPIGEIALLSSIRGTGLAFDHAEIILDCLVALEKEGRIAIDAQ